MRLGGNLKRGKPVSLWCPLKLRPKQGVPFVFLGGGEVCVFVAVVFGCCISLKKQQQLYMYNIIPGGGCLVLFSFLVLFCSRGFLFWAAGGLRRRRPGGGAAAGLRLRGQWQTLAPRRKSRFGGVAVSETPGKIHGRGQLVIQECKNAKGDIH